MVARMKGRGGGRKKQIQKIIGDLYYSPNQPAAFGGAGKLIRAAKKYGIKKATVIRWLRAQGSHTIHKPKIEWVNLMVGFNIRYLCSKNN